MIWLLDSLTRLLIIAAGIDLGITGLFGWNAAVRFLGSQLQIANIIVGFSAVWQLVRGKGWS